MDLFSITCTTCKSRLKVREEGVIGQILACPKCGGMVMVKPPPGWEAGKPLAPPAAEAPPGITSVVEVRRPEETLGDSQFDAVDDLLSDAPPKIKPKTVTVSPDAPGLVRPRFVGAPPPSAGAKPANGSATAVAEPPAAMNGHAAAQVANELPPPQWSNQRPWRYWLLLAAAIVAGVGLTIAVAVASINLFRGEEPQIAQVVPPVTPQPAPAQPTPAQPAPLAPAVTPPAPMPMPVEPVLAEPNPPVQPEPVNPPAVPVEPAPAVPPKPTKPDEANIFDRILNQDQVEAAPVVTAPATPPKPTPADPTEPPAPEKPTLPRPQPRTIDIAARLADPLSGIETEGTSLADFLQVMSELSTIPITLEPDALPLVKASPLAPVKLKVAKTTIGAALTAGLAPLGLEHVIDEDQLVVRIIEPAALQTVKYPVKDLTAGDPLQATLLADMFQGLVLPGNWGAAAGGGTIDVKPDVLSITQRRAGQAQLFFLCEKLRTARKLPYASKFDPALFKLDSRLKLAAPKLNTPVSINFSQPTRFTRILARLEQAAGVRILVDWRSLAAAGWNPDGETTLSADKLPLGETLSQLVGPMDLTWRIVDATTFEVTGTQPAVIEFYPNSPAFADPAAAPLLSGAELDAPSNCLIVALPQRDHEILEGLLAKLAAPPPAGK